jgi:hypothetical protein
MASQDFIDLMTKLYEERYDVLSIKINTRRVGDSFLTVATIVLGKGGEQVTLQSSEIDFILYLVELRGVVDTDGEYRFRRLKDPNQYLTDVEHLIDKDRGKLKEAAKQIISGEFTFTYDAPKLIDEFLRGERTVNNKKFLPLKRDYHYILAHTFLISQETLKAHKRLIHKYPEAERIIRAVDTIMKSFWPTGNAIKDYKFYRSYLKFDIDELSKRVSTELPVADDTIKDFIRRGKIDTDIAIPKMMDIYGRFMELSAPVINLIRIGLELKRGNSSPDGDYKLGQNIEILRSDRDYGTFFGCLDEQIRHADAHASRRIDKAARKILLIDARGDRERIVDTYTFDKFTDMINLMQNQFFPAIFPTLILFDIATLDLLLTSLEYKHLLLAVGNI